MAKTRNGEGSIRARATKGGTVYDVQLTVRNRRTGLSDRMFKGGFKTEKAAVQWRNATMQKSNAEGLVRAKPITVPEVVLGWINSDTTRAPSSDIAWRGVYKNHILPKLNVRVSALTEQTMNDLLGKQLTKGAARNVLSALQASFHWASGPSVGLIDHNPLEGMPRLLKPRAGRREAMPDPLVVILLGATTGTTSGALWHVLAASALRVGEAIGLNWEDVNMLTGEVNVEKIASPESNGKNAALRTKGKRDRKTYLTAEAVTALRAIPGGIGAGKEPIFKSPKGGRLRFTTMTRWWARDCKAAGVGGYVPHSLRHHWATEALASGIPINVVSSILGHANIQTTMIYAHETEAQRKAAVDAVAAALALRRAAS